MYQELVSYLNFNPQTTRRVDDKAYGYKRQWEKAGVPFNHGVLLFLLTYTSEMDREKCESDQFVIDKYQHYLPMIQQAEKETFFI